MAALWIRVSSLVPLPSFYGAIAYDRQSEAYGFAYDQPSPVAEGRRALDRCGSPGCALVLATEATALDFFEAHGAMLR